MRYQSRLICFALSLLLTSACSTAGTATAIPRVQLTMTPESAVQPEATATPGAKLPSPSPYPSAAASPTFHLVIPPTIWVEPSCTPAPDDARLDVDDLPVGEPGHYVNLAMGYWLQYPPSWYTRFGSRPILASFSNLDPGAHNRDSMRAEGCLIEINAFASAYGFTVPELRAQIPRAFAGAEPFELDGVPATRVRVTGAGLFDSDTIYVEHGGRLFTITAEYARGATETCLPAWDDLLRSWKWFEPELAVYRNPAYGYSIAAPRKWYRSNLHEGGLWISSQDPRSIADAAELMTEGMLVMTDVHDNSDGLPLREWLAAQALRIDLASDAPVNGLIGVRFVGPGPAEGVQRMGAYFQGPLGRIYEITCLYPEAQQWEYRPVANAIIYSFGF